MTQRREENMREPELFSGVPIRDDAAHWDELAARVTHAALREGRRAALERFGQSRAGFAAAAALLLAALAYFAAPQSSPSSAGVEWAQALAPADDVGRAIVTRDGPPSIGALMLEETTMRRTP
jgi:hypothetical protein